MTAVEDRLRDELTDRAWDLPVPADPMGWVVRRVSRDRRRRASVALPLCAALLAVTAALATGAVRRDGQDPQNVAGNAREWTTVRDGLQMTARLSDDTPAVGERVTGTLTVTNRRTESVQFLDVCGEAPSLHLDYSPLVATPGTAGTDPVSLFVRRVARWTRSADPADGFFAPSLGSYQVTDRQNRPCPRGGPLVLAAGASTVRHVAWTVGSPNGAAVAAELPARAVFTYLLPPGPDGSPVAGDPSSKGSTTPSARLLDLRFTLALHGGNPDRPGVGEIIQAAADNPTFADVLRQQPSGSWLFGWALTVDKTSTAHGISFGEQDTDPMLNPARRWFVALVYSNVAGTMRTTAHVDGATGRVLSVTTDLEGTQGSG
jgi:hypothetical protein